MKVRIEDGTLYINNNGRSLHDVLAVALGRGVEPGFIGYSKMNDGQLLWLVSRLAKHLLDQSIKQDEQVESPDCEDREGLSFSTYEAEVMPLAFYPGRGTGSITYTALGLAGEAGEVLEKVEGLGLENPAKAVVSASRVAEHAKKALRDDGEAITSERREKIVNELGDVLWYITATAAELGLTLEDVARANIKKLVDRSKRGVLSGEGDKR